MRFNYLTHTTLIAAFAVVVTGCNATSEDANPTATPTTTPTPTGFDDHWTPTSPTARGGTTLDPQVIREGRTARRLTVDQLRSSIPALTGGLTWEGQLRGQTINMFDGLSRTLGEADYIEVTASNTDPSPLFAKFMDDMAGDVCTKTLRADQQKPASDRSIIPYASDVDRNLRFLRLKFHGIHVADGTTDGIVELRGLYDAILAEADAGQAWLGVCVAVLTDPEFMAY